MALRIPIIEDFDVYILPRFIYIRALSPYIRIKITTVLDF